MKKILLTSAILLIIIGGLYLTQNNFLKKGEKLSFSKKPQIVTIANQNFKVTVASSQQEQEIGLSETKSLQQNQGMIFLFGKPDYYSFWMKNMKIPIDIIYINQNTIVTVKNNVQPPKSNNEYLTIYTPTEPADKVLEIQAGLSEKYNFKNGDEVKYENIGN